MIIESITHTQRLGQSLTVLKDTEGNIWYPAKDVCQLLGFKNYRVAVHRYVKAFQKCYALRKKSRGQRVLLINEAGYCRLLFKSKTQAAREQVRKVLDVILPAIQKDGGYLKSVDDLEAATWAARDRE